MGANGDNIVQVLRFTELTSIGTLEYDEETRVRLQLV